MLPRNCISSMLLSDSDGSGICTEQRHGDTASTSLGERDDSSNARAQFSLCVHEHGESLFCALCDQDRNSRSFSVDALLSVLLWTEASRWPPGLVKRYLQHPLRNISLDPVLRGISHYCSRQQDSQFDLFVQLARYNSGATEKSCGVWVPWTCIMRNPQWSSKLNKRWCPKEIQHSLKMSKDRGESMVGRPRRVGAPCTRTPTRGKARK